MRSPTVIAIGVRVCALSLCAGALGSLVNAPASIAAAPSAGVNCKAQDGKISGRGSTLQTWLQYDLMAEYWANVCGPVAADVTANGGDITNPGSAIYSLPGGETYAQNWMTAYNYPSAQILGSSGANAAIGSGAGETAIGCRAEAFAGTDIPVTSSQLAAINGAVPPAGGQSNGKNCDPVNGSNVGLTSPFAPLPQGGANGTDGTEYPNPGDQECSANGPGCPLKAGVKGTMVFPIGISALSIFANLPTSCLPSSGGVQLSTSDMQNIWGGTWTSWNQVPATDGIVQPCDVAITRVVRSDNSGTTQAFDNYLADAFGYSTQTCATSGSAQTFGAMQGNQVTNGTDVNWPGLGTTGTCGAISDSQGAGGPALISAVETMNGAIGYADYSDTQHDTNNFQSLVSGDAIAQFGLEASDGTQDVPPDVQGPGIGASNCIDNSVTPGGGIIGAVGIGGRWDLTAQTEPNQGVDDIAFAEQGSTYPICSLTWDFVWTGEDGNSPPAPTTSGYSAAATIIPVSSVAGLPNQGTFAVAASDGTDTVSYTGLGTDATSCTSVAPPCLLGVTGDTGFVSTNPTMLTFPAGTGGPEPNLTPDQRRTLYSYFTFLMSPAAQESAASAGYAPLPMAWLIIILHGFQAEF